MSKRSGRPRKLENEKAKPNDKVVCDICNATYSRSAQSRHKKSKVHQAYLKANKKISQSVLAEERKMTLMDRAMLPYYDRNGEQIYLTKKQADTYNTYVESKGDKPLFILEEINKNKKSLRERLMK